MIGWLLRMLFGFLLHVLVTLFLWLLGALVSAALRFGPPIFRLCVAVTEWLLFLFDRQLGGWLSRSALRTMLSAGGLWILPGLLIPWLLVLVQTGQANHLSLFWSLTGFTYGLVCGFRVHRLQGWGSWAEADGLQVGENIR